MTHNQTLRELRRFEGRDQCADVDGHDGDDDAGQEDGGQFVDVLHTHKDQQGHQEEADGAVDPHVIQHGRPLAFRVLCLKNGRLRGYVHLQEGGRRGTTSREFVVSSQVITEESLEKKY